MMKPRKRLYMSSQDKMLTGTCGGIAEYLNADPTLVRLAFAVLSLFNFELGVLVYFVLWIIIPAPPKEKARRKKEKKGEWDEVASAAIDNLSISEPESMLGEQSR